jgi:hypothetical protein
MNCQRDVNFLFAVCCGRKPHGRLAFEVFRTHTLRNLVAISCVSLRFVYATVCENMAAK